MQRDLGRQPGELVHLGGIGQLLLHRPRGARSAEDLEPGTGVSERPGGQLDRLMGELVGYVVERGHRCRSSADKKESCGARPEAWWPGTAGLVIDFVELHLVALDLSANQR